MGTTASTLTDLARRAGRWLGLTDTTATAPHTSAVVSDRFDQMSWRETYDQAPALADLADDLGQRYDYTHDLLGDVFLGAYKTSPRVRDAARMDPSRLVNHHIVDSMMTSPEFAELRRDTAGDPYAAAMAVLAQTEGLRRALEHATDAAAAAQRAGDTQREAAEAGRAVSEALDDAAGQAGEDGTVPDELAGAVARAIDAAESAEAAAKQADADARRRLAAAAPGIRTALRPAIADAAENARAEAALMAAWGVGPGQLERMSFEARARLARRLRTGRIGRFAELIGRFRQMATGQRARKVEHAPGELVGITLGDDLSRLVPSEVAGLGVAELRPVFASRYAEGRLMLYDSRGEQTTGKGAIIACIDCSASMSSPAAGGVTGEAWAKACALALLDQARQARRDFAGILFSSAEQVATFRFPATEPADIADVLDLAEQFFGGGTDFETPLLAAVALLAAEYNTEGRPRGDIVFVTDGQCQVGQDWMRGFNDARHQLGFRTFGVAIGAGPATAPGSVLDALCDNLRGIDDLADVHAAADLFRMI